jgi:FKBP-type peptidyl-prolyl cis-trans isomerase
MTLRTFVMIACALAATACGSDSPSTPSEATGTAPYSVTDLRVGTGAEAVLGRPALVNYAGWLYSDTAAENKGRKFDPTGAGYGTFTFTPGASNVIQGWHQGVPGMRVGGLRRLVLPPELAYGAAGRDPIPGNATLLFEIELVAVQ